MFVKREETKNVTKFHVSSGVKSETIEPGNTGNSRALSFRECTGTERGKFLG
jgi:hypothetical protein